MLRHHSAWTAALWTLVLAAGCSDQTRGSLPRIDRLMPDVVPPGMSFVVEGERFGVVDDSSRGHHVTAGGRALRVIEWGASSIEVELPSDMQGGETWVVVTTTAGISSSPAPLTVDSTRRYRPAPPTFPPPGEVGPDEGDGGPSDSGTDGGEGDFGPDAATNLIAEFFPDPGGSGDIKLIPGSDAGPGRLRLEVDLPPDPGDVGGVAFHLAYDRNLLRLESVDPAPGTDISSHGAEIEPGRVAFGRVVPPAQIVTLVFLLSGAGEGRIEFPERHRAVRDSFNQERPEVGFVGGAVSIREIAP